MNLGEVLRAADLVVELLRFVSDLRTKQNGSTSDLDHPDDRRSTAAHSDPAATPTSSDTIGEMVRSIRLR
jgi:hypothetical protein